MYLNPQIHDTQDTLTIQVSHEYRSGNRNCSLYSGICAIRNNNRGGLCNASGPLAVDLPVHRARLRPPLGRAGGILLHGGSPAASREAVRLSGGWVRARFEPLPISGGAGSLF